MFPVDNCASSKHLSSPSGSAMSVERSQSMSSLDQPTPVCNDGDDKIEDQDMERAMILLSNAIGRPQYFRDEIECLLVSVGFFF